MKTHSLIQSSPEWHAFRLEHFGASEAPVVLGVSPYKTRNQLLHEKHTGITPDVDAGTQSRFNDGHLFEALARPIAEKIIGEALSPIVGSNGKFSASFDGITFDDSVIFEHKTINNNLRGIKRADELPEHYRIQMEHQLMVSGAERCLFFATKWDGDVLVDEVHCFYLPDLTLRQRIIAAWEQFAKDLAAYEPPEVIENPVANAIMALPSVVITATGALTASNIEEIKLRWDASIAESKTRLATIDCVNAKAIGKFGRATAVTLKLKAKEVVDQIATVSDAVRTLELYAAEFDKMGLDYEKAAARIEKEDAEKALNRVRTEYADHVAALQVEVEPIRLAIPTVDFAGALRNLRTVESKNNALSTALATAKMNADAIAKDIRAKLAWCKETSAGFGFLFNDLQQIITKPMDDFKLLVTTRIEQYKASEIQKMARIVAEEEAKAQAKAKAEREEVERVAQQVGYALAQEQARIKTEAQAAAKTSAIIHAVETTGTGLVDGDKVLSGKDIFAEPNPQAASQFGLVGKMPATIPNRDAIIEVVAFTFNVDEGTAYQWLRTAFAEVAA